MTATEVERLIVRLMGDGTSYQRMLKEAQASTASATRAIQTETTKIETATNQVNSFAGRVKGWAGTMATVAGIGGALNTVFGSVKLAAQAEEMETSFGVMLRDAAKGKQLVKDLQNLAAKTPLQLGSIQEATKTLLQFGVAGENVIPVLKMLGDATGGDAQRLSQMALAFGQMSSTGHLMGQDLLQMVNAGFNPLQALAEKAAKTMGGDVASQMARLRKEMEQGKITVNRVVEAFRYATSEGGQFAGLMEKRANTLSGLFSTMRDDIDAALRAIGNEIVAAFDLKGIVKGVSEVAAATTDWLSGMSDGTKTAIAAVVAATIAVGGMIAAMVVLKGVITLAFGGLNIVAALFVTATAATAGFIISLGGVGAAFRKVRQWAAEAWEWMKPVRQAIGSFFGAVWDIAKQVWADIKQAAADAWVAIFDDAKINWDMVRDTIRDSIIFAEYALRNLDKVAAMTWTSVQLGAVRFDEQMRYTFGTVMPYLLEYFRRNWREVFTDAFSLTYHYHKNMIANYANLINNLPSLVKGTVKLKDILIDPFEGFQSKIKESLNIPKREIGALEQYLKDKLGKQGDDFMKGFEEFRRAKLKEFAIDPQAARQAQQQADALGASLGKGLTDNIRKETQKFDAAGIFTAEGRQRIEEYTDRIAAMRDRGGFPNAAGGGADNAGALGVARADALALNSPAGKAKTDDYLRDIRDTLKEQSKKPEVVLKPADFNG